MDNYKVTFETWNKVATLYQEKFMDLDLYNDTFDLFCSKIKKMNAKILEVGCGPGNIARYISSQNPGFRIEGIDVAPNMIQLAKENNPTAGFKVMDCRKTDQLQSKYDAIICGFCLPYLDKNEVSKFLIKCSLLLNKNGLLYISVIEGNYNNSGFEYASTGDKSYVYYYQEDFLRKHFQKIVLNLQK